MEKKIMYYVIGGVALIAVVGIILAIQNNQPVPVPVVETPAVEKTVKSETAVNKDIAQKLNLSDGELPLRITMDDNGQTGSLTPGKNLALMLGSEYDWTISTSDNKVLAKRGVVLEDARVQAVYQVVGEGAAVLSAQGKCKSGSQCATPTASFAFNIEGTISENIAPEDLVK